MEPSSSLPEKLQSRCCIAGGALPGRNMMPKHILFLCSLSLMLIGCGTSYNSNVAGGGGGGSAGGASVNSTGEAQGVYSGAASGGYTFSTIILPNDKFYAIYGTVSGNQPLLYGMITGQGTSSNGTYTASVNDFSYTGAVKSGSLSVSDLTGASMDVALAENGTMTTFTGTSVLGSVWDYGITFQTPASLSTVFGTWTGTLLDGMTTTLTISSGGSVTGSGSGCSFTGTVAPDSSSRNFYDVSLTFGGSPCALPNQTATGIGVEYLLSDGVTNQLLAAVTVGNSAGTAFAAER
jgi:hypothetical protein